MLYNPEVEGKLTQIKEYLQNFGPYAIAYACQTTILKIRNRVTRGTNIDGTPYKPYSKAPMYIKSPYQGKSRFYPGGYAEYKATVNPNFLQMTGQMLAGIIYANSEKYGKVYAATQEIQDKIEDNEKLGRKFFGLSEPEADETFNTILEKMKGEINAILGG